MSVSPKIKLVRNDEEIEPGEYEVTGSQAATIPDGTVFTLSGRVHCSVSENAYGISSCRRCLGRLIFENTDSKLKYIDSLGISYGDGSTCFSWFGCIPLRRSTQKPVSKSLKIPIKLTRLIRIDQ